MSVEFVDKYGGSSMADPEQVAVDMTEDSLGLAEIVVVSAPGEGGNYRTKLTQDLRDYHRGMNPDSLEVISERLHELAEPFGKAAVDIASETLNDVFYARTEAEVLSLGERYSARLIAEMTGGVFVDAMDAIFFKPAEANGVPVIDLDRTAMALEHHLVVADGRTLVIPGFHGNLEGKVHLFPFGGSDITAAVTARSVGAETHRNFTNVSGVYTANPKYVEGARPIPHITYDEQRAYGRIGNEVFHVDATNHLVGNDIDTVIKNTFDPANPGTLITDDREPELGETIVGVTGRRGLVFVKLDAHGMNDHPGEIATFAELLNDHNISIEHMPTGKDSMTAIIAAESLGKADFSPFDLSDLVASEFGGYRVESGAIGALCMVGQNMGDNPYVRAEANYIRARTLMEQNIPVFGEDSFGTELSTTFIPEEEVEVGLRALHRAFFESDLEFID